MDNVIERIRKAKINLYYKNPFFAYLLHHLKCQEFGEELEKHLNSKGQIPTLAVDKYSNLYYSPEFILSLDEEDLKSSLIHEILHISLNHLSRLKRQFKECPDGANISADAIVFTILEKNNFDIKSFKPRKFKGQEYSAIYVENDIFTYGKLPNQIKIENVSKKTAEEIYDELMSQAKDKNMIKYVSSDNHLFGDEDDEDSEESKAKNKELEKEWKKRMIEASEVSKQAGKTPLGMERFIDELLEDKINWRQILQREIKKEAISDYSWQRRSKKSIACGFYLPNVKKENIEIKIVIDLSGSISEEDLKDFLSEIIGMSRAFPQIKMTLLTHETKVNDIYEINRANEDKIRELKLNGGGGTSFSSVVKYLNENTKGNELVIWLTDGYGDSVTNKDLRFRLLWVLTKEGSDECIKGTGRIVKLE